MKIIFLDIDGVLNSQLFFTKKRKRKKDESKETYHLSMIDATNVAYLNSLIADTGAKVVISSAWRMGNEMPYLQSLLDKKGFKGEIIAFTPVHRWPNSFRGIEIYEWIQENHRMLGVECASDFRHYVILDDDSDMLYWQRYNFIHVDAYCGLTPNQCYRAKKILNH